MILWVLAYYTGISILFFLFIKFILSVIIKVCLLTFFFLLQDWALELELVVGVMRMGDNFLALGRWGASRVLKKHLT